MFRGYFAQDIQVNKVSSRQINPKQQKQMLSYCLEHPHIQYCMIQEFSHVLNLNLIMNITQQSRFNFVLHYLQMRTLRHKH